MTKKYRKVESSLTARATASVKIAVENDLREEDKNLEELINEKSELDYNGEERQDK